MDAARAARPSPDQPPPLDVPAEVLRLCPPELAPRLAALHAALEGICGPRRDAPALPGAKDAQHTESAVLFALAYSGGLDSRFLTHAARLLGFRPLLLHATGPHVPPEETQYARAWAASQGLPLTEVPADPLSLPLVAAGDRRRCYACKRELFSRLLETLERPAPPVRSDGVPRSGLSGASQRPAADEERPAGCPSSADIPAAPSHAPSTAPGQLPFCGYESPPGDVGRNPAPCRLPLCDGTNASDLTTYRPGIQAVQELGVRSPLAEAGLCKDDIRRIAAATGMEAPGQKARPCLLTRLPYGARPQRETLEALARAEQAVRLALQALALPDADFRLRLPAPDKAELHMLRADAARLSPQAAESLLHAASQAAPALPAPSLVPQDSLSGYYDRPPSGVPVQNTL